MVDWDTIYLNGVVKQKKYVITLFLRRIFRRACNQIARREWKAQRKTVFKKRFINTKFLFQKELSKSIVLLKIINRLHNLKKWKYNLNYMKKFIAFMAILAPLTSWQPDSLWINCARWEMATWKPYGMT
jgi:hypothetical protein